MKKYVGGEALNEIINLVRRALSTKAEKTYVNTEVGKKQNEITGGASTITTENLTGSRVLVSNADGKVASSDVTSTELGYLDGVKSPIQTQLDSLKEYVHDSIFTAMDSIY